jgi:hypothetical protein
MTAVVLESFSEKFLLSVHNALYCDPRLAAAHRTTAFFHIHKIWFVTIMTDGELEM